MYGDDRPAKRTRLSEREANRTAGPHVDPSIARARRAMAIEAALQSKRESQVVQPSQSLLEPDGALLAASRGFDVDRVAPQHTHSNTPKVVCTTSGTVSIRRPASSASMGLATSVASDCLSPNPDSRVAAFNFAASSGTLISASFYNVKSAVPILPSREALERAQMLQLAWEVEDEAKENDPSIPEASAKSKPDTRVVTATGENITARGLGASTFAPVRLISVS